MKKLFGEYRDFINQGNVITVAVGLVMALYFKSIVDAFINGVIMPIVSAIVGEENFGTSTSGSAAPPSRSGW